MPISCSRHCLQGLWSVLSFFLLQPAATSSKSAISLLFFRHQAPGPAPVPLHLHCRHQHPGHRHTPEPPPTPTSPLSADPSCVCVCVCVWFILHELARISCGFISFPTFLLRMDISHPCLLHLAWTGRYDTWFMNYDASGHGSLGCSLQVALMATTLRCHLNAFPRFIWLGLMMSLLRSDSSMGSI